MKRAADILKRPPPDPYLYQLAANHEAIMRRVLEFRALGWADVAVICILTKDQQFLAHLGRSTGQELKPIEYDVDKHGGLMGAGKRGEVVETLRKIYGSRDKFAAELERIEFRSDVLPAFIQIPSGHQVLLRWTGGSS